MADGLKEALSKFVPASVLDEAVEAIKETEVSPEWYRSDIAKVGARAKQADEFEARLNSIESAPKRKEALKRVGIDYDAQPKYAQKVLDSYSGELDKLEDLASFVKDEGFEANLSTDETTDKSAAAQITDAMTSLTGEVVRTDKQAEMHKQLDAAAAKGDEAEYDRILAAHGQLDE
jgi:predicted  nucleic acid-binding Zn-ribbon protein